MILLLIALLVADLLLVCTGIASVPSLAGTLALSLGILSVVYLACLLRDIILARSCVRAISRLLQLGVSAGTDRSGREAAPLILARPITSVGHHAAAVFEALHYRVQTLSWESQAREVIRAPIGAAMVEHIKSALDVAHSAHESEDQFFERMLVEVSRRFRCRALALILQIPGGERRVIVNGIRSGRFERQILHHFDPYFSLGSYDDFGFRDGETEGVTDRFTAYGVRTSLSSPLGGTTGWKGVLWLGYSPRKPPSDFETSIVGTVCEELSAEIESFRAVSRLSVRAVEAERATRANAEAIAQLSHDLRSPVSNVKAILELLHEDALTSEQEEILTVASTNCDRTADLISDLLDFSRYQIGGLSSRKEKIALSELARSVVRSFSVTAKLKGLRLTLVEELERDEVLADRGQLQRILTNLVSNALKYTPHGFVEVSLKTCGLDEAMIRVSDSGLGLSEAQIGMLFTPFSRFHEVHADGVGLGLALSKILAEKNGATLAVRSKVGEGSHFELRLRLAECSSSNDKPPPDVTAPRPTVLVESYVLVVDDDVECAEALARALERLNHRVKRASGVREAIECILGSEVRAIISDASMPGGGVRRILEEIAQRRIAIPVLVVSGHEGRERELLSQGVDCVLTKPASLADITNWLAAHLQGAPRLVA